jgi:hypothetical protein
MTPSPEQWPAEKVAELRRLVCLRHDALLRQIEFLPARTGGVASVEWCRAHNDFIEADEALEKLGVHF